jgi:alkylhydroperoxidase family enzyme
MKKDDLDPGARAAWINLPHARTIAERIERQLEILRVLEGERSRPLNTALIALRHHLEPWIEDADPETAATAADPVVDRSRDLVKAIVDDERARGDRLGQCIRNLFECLGLPNEGRRVSLACGEDPDSLMR